MCSIKPPWSIRPNYKQAFAKATTRLPWLNVPDWNYIQHLQLGCRTLWLEADLAHGSKRVTHSHKTKLWIAPTKKTRAGTKKKMMGWAEKAFYLSIELRIYIPARNGRLTSGWVHVINNWCATSKTLHTFISKIFQSTQQPSTTSVDKADTRVDSRLPMLEKYNIYTRYNELCRKIKNIVICKVRISWRDCLLNTTGACIRVGRKRKTQRSACEHPIASKKWLRNDSSISKQKKCRT